MHGRIMFLRDHTQLPVAQLPQPQSRLKLVVLYTNPALTAQALAAAVDLARGFEAELTLMAVYVLPYPTPLEIQEGVRKRLESDLTAVARTSPAPIHVKLVFARDRVNACLGMLPREALVVIGTKDRWWRTREESLARRLTSGGHSVAVIRVR